MKKSKLLTLLLATAMGVSMLAGCAGNNDSKVPKTTIELLTWHGPDSATNFYDGYLQVAKDYMAKHKDVEIKIKYENDGTYGSILETGFAGGTASDIIQMKSAQRSTFKANLLNLRSALNEQNPYDTRNAKWIDNFVDGEPAFPIEDNGTDANSLLFIPNDTNTKVYAGNMYIFNKKIIKDAGLDPEKTPKDWKEMFTWLDAISKNKDIAPIAGSSDLGGKVSQMGYGFGENYSHKYFDDKFNKPEFFYDQLYILTCYTGGTNMPLVDLPYYPAMFKLMKQHLSYYQTSWKENTPETEILTFASGKAAMKMTSFYDFGSLTSSLASSKFPDGYGIFPIPYFGKDTLAYAVEKGWITQQDADAAQPYAVDRYASGQGIGQHEYGFTVNKKVADDPKKLAATIDFLRFLSSKEEQDKYVEIATSLSPVNDVKLADTLKNFIIPEPAGGFAQNVLGYTVVEWGKSGWDVELLKYLNGQAEMESTVKAVAAPEWVKDIPTVQALKDAEAAAKAEYDAATDNADKKAAYEYAQLRRELFENYYYNQKGDLKEIK